MAYLRAHMGDFEGPVAEQLRAVPKAKGLIEATRALDTAIAALDASTPSVPSELILCCLLCTRFADAARFAEVFQAHHLKAVAPRWTRPATIRELESSYEATLGIVRTNAEVAFLRPSWKMRDNDYFLPRYPPWSPRVFREVRLSDQGIEARRWRSPARVAWHAVDRLRLELELSAFERGGRRTEYMRRHAVVSVGETELRFDTSWIRPEFPNPTLLEEALRAYAGQQLEEPVS